MVASWPGTPEEAVVSHTSEARAVGASRRIKKTQAARDFRDGLLIALLASRPLRIKNLLMTQIGSHLRQSGSRTTLHYAATETKGHRSYDTVRPDHLGPALTRYLAEVRPLLAAAPPRGRSTRPPGAYLWLAQGGSPMTEASLHKAIVKHTRLRFGHAITPHLFRDCAATTVGNETPDRVRDAAQLLGHATFRTTERAYIAANSVSALQQYHELLARMHSERRRGRKLPRNGVAQ